MMIDFLSRVHLTKLFDNGTLEVVRVGKPMEHSSWVVDLAIRTDGSKIVSGSTYGRIIRWVAETGKKIDDPINVAGWTENLVISSCGRIIACGSQISDYVE